MTTSDKIGKRGIWATFICSAVFFFLGALFTRWIAIDTEAQYQKRLLTNALAEIEYNLGIGWYQSEEYVETAAIWSELQTSAMWTVYYNSATFWPGESATADKILNCLDEIDYINRRVGYQAPNSTVLQIVTGPGLELEPAQNPEDPTIQYMSNIHTDMLSRYSKSVKPLLNDSHGYISEKLKQY